MGEYFDNPMNTEDADPNGIDAEYEAARADVPEEFDPLKPGRSVCIYQRSSATRPENKPDKRHPYLCTRDDRYATADWCAKCKREGWRTKNA